MAPSRRRASNSAATIWSRPRIVTPRLPLPRAFPAPRRVRSRSGRSWSTTDSEAVIPGGPFGPSRNDIPKTASPMTPTEIEKIFRDEAGRALATLIRLVGDFDLAQDALQDAFAVALERWPHEDPPSNPRAWLVNVGRNKAIDRVRRQIAFRGKQRELMHELLYNADSSDDVA